MFSPDGRTMAFVSDESGRAEVYVTPFPGPGPRIQVSNAGGIEPLWSRSGTELFYRSGTKMMSVAIRGEALESPSPPRVLFDGRFESADYIGAEVANYDVTPDGQRFIMVRRKSLSSLPTTIKVIFNWPTLLSR